MIFVLIDYVLLKCIHVCMNKDLYILLRFIYIESYLKQNLIELNYYA